MRVKREFIKHLFQVHPVIPDAMIGADVKILDIEGVGDDEVALFVSAPAQHSPLKRTLWLVEEKTEIPHEAAEGEFLGIISPNGKRRSYTAVFIETQDQALARAASNRR